MNCKKPEILAPAGSLETLSAALRVGADAVYVGGKRFSARNNAENFSLDELKKAAELCHLYDAQLHLAVNTIISDDELEDFCGFIKSAAEIGVDAFIVQDLGAASIIRKAVPDAVIHGSTQMSVHTASGAKLLKEMGYARVVPSRELDMHTIKNIKDTGIETEIFAHGALCMSVSGQCYMSAVIGSRSANRGCCGQACRLPFSACGKKGFSALSLKDLSLLPVMDKVMELAPDSLKIEGRMKRPEYTASAVHSMKSAIDGEKPDMQMLRSIFSRSGFTDGYFSGDRKDMFGVRLKEDGESAASYFPQIHELYRGERKIRKVDFHCIIKENQPVNITASCGEFSVSASGEIPQKALNRPTDTEMLCKQLSRLGDTVFELGNITAELDEGLIVPAGKLNELRRQLIEKLSDEIISRSANKWKITDYSPKNTRSCRDLRSEKPPVRVFCRTAEQAAAVDRYSEFLILPVELVSEGKADFIRKEKVILSPPRFIADEKSLREKLSLLHENGYEHLLCHTPDTIYIGRETGFTLHGSFGLNVYNSLSVEMLRELGIEDFVVSFEAKASQIAQISAEIPMGAVTYGRLPLMLTRNCPVKNEIGCRNCSGQLTDRTGRSFPVACGKDFVEILNSEPLYMGDKPELTGAVDFAVILLHDEDSDAAVKAVRGFKPSGNITRGLYFRGI